MDPKNILNPNTTALIVVDKQASYFDPILVQARNQKLPTNSHEVVSSIDKFIEESRNNNVEVIWTQMVEDADLSPSNISIKMKSDPDDVTSISRPGDESFEIYGRVKPKPSEKTIVKFRYDAFSQTDLAFHLKNAGIKTVILVGGYASRCVLSTASGANGNDFLCVVPRELVINQSKSSSEVEVLYNIVDAIYGLTLDANKITSIWNNYKKT